MIEPKLCVRLEDGTYRLPPFVDAHVHVESSHLTPSRFGAVIALNGTLHAVCDPHEIVNVMGEKGLDWMLADARRSLAELHFSLPSCVPSTPFETSGAEISAEDTKRLFAKYPELIGLGEMMDVSGVLGGNREVLAKIAAARSVGKPIDGHFPGGCGEQLKRYAAAGISSDHESVSAGEALEKVAVGMTVFIREGSAAKNLEAVLPAVNDGNWERFAFCTDDISAHDLLNGGGILGAIRKAVRLGMDPERAVALGSVNAARHFGIRLAEDDYVVVRDLKDFEIVRVVKGGRTLVPDVEARAATSIENTVHLPALDAHVFSAPMPDAAGEIEVIGVNDGSLLTDRLVRRADNTDDLMTLLTVIERHGRNGNIASAWTARTGLRRGAIASTVAHDHHNLIVLGNESHEIRLAAERLRMIGGGLCVVLDGAVAAEMPLPVAGLMSCGSASDVSACFADVLAAARRTGCTLTNPFATMSFLALPVIPELKLTDRGLFVFGQALQG